MVNKRSSIQKTTNSMIPFIWPSNKAKLFYRERNQNSGCLWGGQYLLRKGMKELSGVMEMFYILTGVVAMTRLYAYVKSYQTVHSRCVYMYIYADIYICKLYLKVILMTLPSMSIHLICYL